MTSRSHVTWLLRGSDAHQRITKALLMPGICAVLLLWGAAPARAQSITITDHAPVTNAVGVAISAPITASFDATVQANTVTTRTFTVRSSLRGLYTDTAAVSGNTVTVDPVRNFFTGEQVQVVGTAAISSTGAVPLRAQQWGFTAGPVTNRCVVGFTDSNAGLPGVYLSSVAWGDYDNDGNLDILLTGQTTDSGAIARVYRNDGGAFTDINAGLPGVISGSVAWGDYDNDGDLDILLTGNGAGSPIARVYRNDGGAFTDINAGLPGVRGSSAGWGDYDNDGDLDILLTGHVSFVGPIARVYRNDGGAFTNINAGLPGVQDSSVAWGDYDNDGDLDILLTGGDADIDAIARVYRNDGGAFSDISAGLTGVSYSSVAWGDYDNDGDLDILLTGGTGSEVIARVYRNDGGSFSDINAGLPGVLSSSVAWGDYDNDGDLDILLTGDRGTDGSQITRVYRNDDCPDVGINKTVTPAISVPGTAITYTLHFSNTGPGIASSVTLTDSVPAGVAITGVSSSGAPITQTAGSPNFAWAVSDLVPGAGGIITLTGVTIGIFDADTVITNTAAITTPVDANAGNNLVATPLAVNLHRVAFSAATYTAAEVDGAVTVTVTLNAPNPVTAVSVVVQSSDGSASAPDDYTPVSRTLNFPAGTQQVAFSVPLVDDGIAEQPEVFTLALSAPTNAALGAPAVATVTLVSPSQLFLPMVKR